LRAGSKGHVHSTLSGKVTSKGRGPRGDRVVLGTVAKPRTDSLLPFPLPSFLLASLLPSPPLSLPFFFPLTPLAFLLSLSFLPSFSSSCFFFL